MGNKEIHVDIRLISATNLDLEKMVENNQFREDLFYRIHAMRINLPSLRERGTGIDEIIIKKIHELSVYYKVRAKGISSEFFETLRQNPWPGNIRQLINVLEYALASAGSDPTLVPKHLPPEYRLVGIDFDMAEENDTTRMIDEVLDFNSDFPQLNVFRQTLEKIYLERLLKKADGNRKAACRLSGISQSQLYTLLGKYNLPGFGPK
ncbi:MAG: sigma 54-interacting transcriptional regulator [Desulfobacter postgatei]|nr:sigma 54-interacting transcriptional regulator [Desulfobacter postgatei]MDD4274032.1 sigma 54-interacting transcriptional regulator [Desulfobacter postgatei]